MKGTVKVRKTYLDGTPHYKGEVVNVNQDQVDKYADRIDFVVEERKERKPKKKDKKYARSFDKTIEIKNVEVNDNEDKS